MKAMQLEWTCSWVNGYLRSGLTLSLIVHCFFGLFDPSETAHVGLINTTASERNDLYLSEDGSYRWCLYCNPEGIHQNQNFNTVCIDQNPQVKENLVYDSDGFSNFLWCSVVGKPPKCPELIFPAKTNVVYSDPRHRYYTHTAITVSCGRGYVRYPLTSPPEVTLGCLGNPPVWNTTLSGFSCGLAVPSNVQCNQTDTEHICLTWSYDGGPVEQFNITVISGDHASLSYTNMYAITDPNNPPGSFQYSIPTKPVQGESYVLMVTAISAGVASLPSSPSTLTIAPSTPVDASISGLTVENVTVDVILGLGKISALELELKDSENVKFTQTLRGLSSSPDEKQTITAVADLSLVPGETYRARVRAVAGSKNSGWTRISAPKTVAPSTPVNVSISELTVTKLTLVMTLGPGKLEKFEFNLIDSTGHTLTKRVEKEMSYGINKTVLTAVALSLVQGESYSAQVRTVAGSEHSNWSAPTISKTIDSKTKISPEDSHTVVIIITCVLTGVVLFAVVILWFTLRKRCHSMSCTLGKRQHDVKNCLNKSCTGSVESPDECRPLSTTDAVDGQGSRVEADGESLVRYSIRPSNDNGSLTDPKRFLRNEDTDRESQDGVEMTYYRRGSFGEGKTGDAFQQTYPTELGSFDREVTDSGSEETYLKGGQSEMEQTVSTASDITHVYSIRVDCEIPLSELEDLDRSLLDDLTEELDPDDCNGRSKSWIALAKRELEWKEKKIKHIKSKLGGNLTHGPTDNVIQRMIERDLKIGHLVRFLVSHNFIATAKRILKHHKNCSYCNVLIQNEIC